MRLSRTFHMELLHIDPLYRVAQKKKPFPPPPSLSVVFFSGLPCIGKYLNNPAETQLKTGNLTDLPPFIENFNSSFLTSPQRRLN